MSIKISVVKYEKINGKKFGKSFSFPMDVERMGRYKTSTSIKKKVEEYIVNNKFFRKEELGDLEYDMKEFLKAWRSYLKNEGLNKMKAS
jgi:hypothetical protein